MSPEGQRRVLVFSMSLGPGYLISTGDRVQKRVFAPRDSKAFFLRLGEDLREVGGVKALSDIVVDIGPGSFTGIRMALAVVKTWGVVFPEKRFYGLSNLRSVGWMLGDRSVKTVVLPSVRGSVYALELNLRGGELVLRREEDLKAFSPGEVVWVKEVDPEVMYRCWLETKPAPQSPGDINPLYIYPDDCSVQKN